MKIVPDKFEGYYEIKHPDTVKVWGEAAATCRWTIVCYEECEINAKVQKQTIFFLFTIDIHLYLKQISFGLNACYATQKNQIDSH